MKTIKSGSRGDDVKTLQRLLNLIPDGIFGKLTDEAVRQFQHENGLVEDGIVGPKTWEKLGVNTNPRTINKLIVHCAATPEGKDFTTLDIRRWHLQRGFSDIGYHYVIYRDGTVMPGRSESVVGAHTAGYNSHSIGICYIGGMDAQNKHAKDTRTPEQKQSLLKLLKELKAKYPKATIHGHREFAAKACPSFDAKAEYKDL